ncbi:MAG: hypothetical protein JXB38_19735 [Anaerolineales bacterium]|nr:hypothetical protein [Anaerolineales bacterium]
MDTIKPVFQLGVYRPVYLWGGPGTIRMNRLKFMDEDVDEFVHNEAHTAAGAQRVREIMRCNWVHLMYDWGFPPEVEQEDWESFAGAAEVYHASGDKVFAYIQTSNCAYQGSYKEKDWYALNERGQRIFYYSGRYMTCLMNAAWRAHLREMVAGAIERGADGIFFDNMWHGAQPISLLNTWLGGVGCYCPDCQKAYFEFSGEPIPTHIDPQDLKLARYLRWRADQVTALIAEIREYIHSLQPDTPISANDYDIMMRDSYLIYGQDLRALADVQEITMIENFALPRWDALPKPRLANNALTVRTARQRVGDRAHLSILSYDVGIGFDGVYPTRRYRQGMAEASALGVSMTTKGTEYHEDGKHTLLTAAQFGNVQRAIGDFHAWLETHTELYAGRTNAAPAALLYPGERLWLDWQRLAPLYHGLGQTLTAAGIPWKVVEAGDDLAGVEVLFSFGAAVDVPEGVQVIDVLQVSGWELPEPAYLNRNPVLRALVTGFVHALFRGYMGSKLVRILLDAAGMPKLITQSPLFLLPDAEHRAAMLAQVGDAVYPRVESAEPVLIEVWGGGQGRQVHLVNYAQNAQCVEVLFGAETTGRILSPDSGEEIAFAGQRVPVDLDVYMILLCD